jgi:hypothetical protein
LSKPLGVVAVDDVEGGSGPNVLLEAGGGGVVDPEHSIRGIDLRAHLPIEHTARVGNHGAGVEFDRGVLEGQLSERHWVEKVPPQSWTLVGAVGEGGDVSTLTSPAAGVAPALELAPVQLRVHLIDE